MLDLLRVLDRFLSVYQNTNLSSTLILCLGRISTEKFARTEKRIERRCDAGWVAGIHIIGR